MTWESLCERLERKFYSGLRTTGSGIIGHGPDGQIKVEMLGDEAIMIAANPDGLEASALIRAMAATLEEIQNAPTVMDGGSINWCRNAAKRVLTEGGK